MYRWKIMQCGDCTMVNGHVMLDKVRWAELKVLHGKLAYLKTECRRIDGADIWKTPKAYHPDDVVNRRIDCLLENNMPVREIT
jgi:hypothetical protein